MMLTGFQLSENALRNEVDEGVLLKDVDVDVEDEKQEVSAAAAAAAVFHLFYHP